MLRRVLGIGGLGLLAAVTVGWAAGGGEAPRRAVAAAAGSGRIETPRGVYTDLQAALADAEAGDVLVVQGGVYGPITLTTSLTLQGREGATLDGGGQGHVVEILAPDVTLAGFQIRRSGTLGEHEDAGIMVRAARATIRGNVLESVLYGISLKDAADSLVVGNTVDGYAFASGRRGDGLRAWFSPGVQFRDNRVQGMRDVLLQYADNAVVTGNRIAGGRYGLHFMYTSGMMVERNEVAENSIGMFLMYSSDVTVRQNYFHDNFGPSGIGLGLKEVANVTVQDNVLVRNRVGISLDTTPFGVEAFARVSGNLLAFNQTGLSMEPNVQRAELVGNAFDRNGAQVQAHGRGGLEGNTWTGAEGGNFWSDYVGYDADNDGLGDVPYEARSLFASLREERPALSVFNYTPAAAAIDFAARAIPDLRPSPEVVDDAPLMNARRPAWFASGEHRAWPWLLAGAILAIIPVAVLQRLAPLPAPGPRTTPRALLREERPDPVGVALSLEDVTKRYDGRVVLDRLTLQVPRGQAVALWGSNGAGKTTAIRCILGLVRHDGAVLVNGVARHTDERAARRQMGYVPQDQQLPDLPIRELLAFFCELRSVPRDAGLAETERAGLSAHLNKRPRELSGGLRQRFALALAQLGQPPILLLDEPTANLDQASRAAMLSLLSGIRAAGTTIVFTTHRAEEVVQLADRVVTLDQGRMAVDTPVDAFAQSVSEQAVVYIRVAPADRARARAALAAEQLTADSHEEWLLVGGAPHRVLATLWRANVEVLDSFTGRGQ